MIHFCAFIVKCHILYFWVFHTKSHFHISKFTVCCLFWTKFRIKILRGWGLGCRRGRSSVAPCVMIWWRSWRRLGQSVGLPDFLQAPPVTVPQLPCGMGAGVLTSWHSLAHCTFSHLLYQITLRWAVGGFFMSPEAFWSERFGQRCEKRTVALLAKLISFSSWWSDTPIQLKTEVFRLFRFLLGAARCSG